MAKKRGIASPVLAKLHPGGPKMGFCGINEETGGIPERVCGIRGYSLVKHTTIFGAICSIFKGISTTPVRKHILMKLFHLRIQSKLFSYFADTFY